MNDTRDEALKVHIQLFKQATPQERFHKMRKLSEAAISLAKRAI